mgnify:FL=1
MQVPLMADTQGLPVLLRAWQQAHGFQSFALCASCRFNQPQAGGGAICGLTGEMLSEAETGKICRDHEFA